jgi:hypothetical protein
MKIAHAAMAFSIALAGPVQAADIEVDVELVLAVDMSGSMDPSEHALQRGGYVEALRSPEFWEAIRKGAWRRVAVSYLEWAGAGQQVVVMDWTLIDSAEAARAFADALEAQPLSRIRGTSISGAIDRARTMFHGNGYEGFTRVIDISGDGANNRGRPVTEARDDALAEGIVINGLPLVVRVSPLEGDLAQYYADCVIGGPGSFSLPVRRFEDVADAVRRKLVLEIAGGPPPARYAQASPQPQSDCLAGERARRFFEP